MFSRLHCPCSFWKSSKQWRPQQFNQIRTKSMIFEFIFHMWCNYSYKWSSFNDLLLCNTPLQNVQLKTATVIFVYPSVVWLGLCWAVLLFVSIEVSHADAVRWLCSQVWCPSGDSWEAVTFCSFTFYVASLGFFSWCLGPVAVVQLLSRVQLFMIPWTVAHQASLHHLPEFAQVHVHWVSDAI